MRVLLQWLTNVHFNATSNFISFIHLSPTLHWFLRRLYLPCIPTLFIHFSWKTYYSLGDSVSLVTMKRVTICKTKENKWTYPPCAHTDSLSLSFLIQYTEIKIRCVPFNTFLVIFLIMFDWKPLSYSIFGACIEERSRLHAVSGQNGNMTNTTDSLSFFINLY
jgi:hypothetical protein